MRLTLAEEKRVMLHRRPRLGHPVGDRGLSPQVVRGLLVTGEVLLCPVRLVQHEAGRVVLGLENAPAAMIGLLEGKNFGKLVVRVGPD